MAIVPSRSSALSSCLERQAVAFKRRSMSRVKGKKQYKAQPTMAFVLWKWSIRLGGQGAPTSRWVQAASSQHSQQGPPAGTAPGLPGSAWGLHVHQQHLRYLASLGGSDPSLQLLPLSPLQGEKCLRCILWMIFLCSEVYMPTYFLWWHRTYWVVLPVLTSREAEEHPEWQEALGVHVRHPGVTVPSGISVYFL